MILKLRYREGYINPTYKQVVELNTDNYPELFRFSTPYKIGYIKDNAHVMSATTGSYVSLKEELMSQGTDTPPFSESFYSIMF
jgi:hypothetical protein